MSSLRASTVSRSSAPCSSTTTRSPPSGTRSGQARPEDSCILIYSLKELRTLQLNNNKISFIGDKIKSGQARRLLYTYLQPQGAPLLAAQQQQDPFHRGQDSVAEPPLFWAATAPAPGGQGPGADCGSDLLVSAPAPG